MDLPTRLDTETQSLLETLAAGVYSEEQRCWWCGVQVTLYTQEAHAVLHTAICPTRRARVRLAQNGTPVKMWIISFASRRFNHTQSFNSSLRVVKCDLSEEDALTLVMNHIAQYQEKRQFVEGSLQVQEIALMG